MSRSPTTSSSVDWQRCRAPLLDRPRCGVGSGSSHRRPRWPPLSSSAGSVSRTPPAGSTRLRGRSPRITDRGTRSRRSRDRSPTLERPRNRRPQHRAFGRLDGRPWSAGQLRHAVIERLTEPPRDAEPGRHTQPGCDTGPPASRPTRPSRPTQRSRPTRHRQADTREADPPRQADPPREADPGRQADPAATPSHPANPSRSAEPETSPGM